MHRNLGSVRQNNEIASTGVVVGSGTKQRANELVVVVIIDVLGGGVPAKASRGLLQSLGCIVCKHVSNSYMKDDSGKVPHSRGRCIMGV